MRSSLSNMGSSPCVQGKRYTGLPWDWEAGRGLRGGHDYGVTVITGIKADKSGG